MPHPGVEEELAQEFSTGEFSAVSVDPANTVLERDESPWTSWALLLNAYQQAVCLM